MTDPIAGTTFRGLKGDVFRPGDEGYEDARTIWNARFDRRPALIVRCRGADDVVAAIAYAREHDLPLAVRSGGHDYAGNSSCDDGLVIDLAAMRAVRIDPGSKSAVVQPGATWGEFDTAAQAHGLATTGGTVSTVGVAGFTLGGGSGWLSRRFGLGLDNLTAAELVTADGRHVRLSENENPELFWGIRGGSGNFGVVTSLEYRLHDVGPDVLAGQIVHPFEAAGDVLRHYRDFMRDAPDELQGYAFILHVPPVEGFPEKHHGQPAVFLVVAWSGDLAEGEKLLRPLRDFGDPMLEFVGPQPYVALQQSFDAAMPKGYRWYTRAHYLKEISDGAIGAVVKHTRELPGPFTAVYFGAEGGAIGRVDSSATAFPHRDAGYGLHIFPGWTDPIDDEAIMQWARDFHRATAPFATGGVYVNLMAEDQERGAEAAYGRNYDRMAGLKRVWDPNNVFRLNHNVRP